MLRLLILIFACILLPISAFATDTDNRITNVIYITLDGTRWQEVYLSHKYFPHFWQKYANSFSFYGKPKSDDTIEVASTPISLPSYQSQMAGYLQPCANNSCGRIQVETLPENLVHTYGFSRKDVAVFASWYEISYAVEHINGTTFTNAGNMPVADPLTQQADKEMDKINQEQALDHPEGSDRFDKYTFAQALHYFKKYQPKFLWIALQDSDEAAHEGDWPEYLRKIAFYDQAMDNLFKTLKRLKLYKSTLVIVTTDHGRGNGKNWITHGVKIPESKQTWALVMNGKLKPNTQGNSKDKYDSLSFRPTMEEALGLMF